MKAFMHIYASQARLFLRDKVPLALTLFLPVLLAVFFGFIFSSFDGEAISIVVVNEDSGRTAGFAVDKLIAEGSGEQLSFLREATREAAMARLEDGSADLLIVFPEGLSDAFDLGDACEIPVIYDSSKSQMAGVARLVADNIVAELNLHASLADRILSTKPSDVAKSQPSLAEFYIPNFLAISILWLSIFATAIPLVKQREDKTLRRIGVAPISKASFMAGVTLWRLSVGVVQSGLFLAVAAFALKADVLARWPLFFAAILLANLAFTAMGYMIAAVSKTVQAAEGLAQLFNFLFMFLSGVFFTAGMLPEVLSAVSYAIPLTYMADLFRQLMVGYEGLFPLWLDFAVLGGCGLLFAGVSLKAWRWD